MLSARRTKVRIGTNCLAVRPGTKAHRQEGCLSSRQISLSWRTPRQAPAEPMVCRLTAGGRWIRTIGSASWRAHEVRPDSLPEGTGFEPSVPLLRKGLSAVAERRCRTDKLEGSLSTSPLARRAEGDPSRSTSLIFLNHHEHPSSSRVSAAASPPRCPGG